MWKGLFGMVGFVRLYRRVEVGDRCKEDPHVRFDWVHKLAGGGI